MNFSSSEPLLVPPRSGSHRDGINMLREILQQMPIEYAVQLNSFSTSDILEAAVETLRRCDVFERNLQAKIRAERGEKTKRILATMENKRAAATHLTKHSYNNAKLVTFSANDDKITRRKGSSLLTGAKQKVIAHVRSALTDTLRLHFGDQWTSKSTVYEAVFMGSEACQILIRERDYLVVDFNEKYWEYVLKAAAHLLPFHAATRQDLFDNGWSLPHMFWHQSALIDWVLSLVDCLMHPPEHLPALSCIDTAVFLLTPVPLLESQSVGMSQTDDATLNTSERTASSSRNTSSSSSASDAVSSSVISEKHSRLTQSSAITPLKGDLYKWWIWRSVDVGKCESESGKDYTPSSSSPSQKGHFAEPVWVVSGESHTGETYSRRLHAIVSGADGGKDPDFVLLSWHFNGFLMRSLSSRTPYHPSLECLVRRTG